MTLKDAAQVLRQKGFPRQATLLESRAGMVYLEVLTNPFNAEKVIEQIGEDSYKLLEKQKRKISKTERLLKIIFESSFQSRQYQSKPLEIAIENTFNESTLQESFEKASELWKSYVPAIKLIYKNVEKETKNNDELVFEIYKDWHRLPETEEEINEARDYFPRLIKSKVERCERLISVNVSQTILFNEINALLERGVPYEVKEEIAQDDVENILSAAKKILEDKNALEEAFQRYLDIKKKGHYQNTIESGRGHSQFVLSEFRDQTYCGYFRGNFYYVSEDGEIDFEETLETGLVQKLMKYSLDIKKGFIDHYEMDYSHIHDKIIGLEQILAGGQITNPTASQVSTLQNHGGFPNIPCSDKTLKTLIPLVEKIKTLFDEIPDISDLTLPGKIRKKRNHSYSVEELPKDPLDVTFGNDSGCCIFVPEELKDLQNGFSVPLYLYDKGVRLFGVYREDNKKSRMGLVLTFETRLPENLSKKILTCNSLEISRFGVVGGRETLNKITNYVEDWLIGYSKKHGYYGLAMGSHSYNTSANYSNKTNDKVMEELIYAGRIRGFYSDIFTFDKESDIVKTRPNSLYWLWKKSV